MQSCLLQIGHSTEDHMTLISGALFTLGKTAILKIAVFCVTIYTCQKNREVRAGTKDRDFFDRYCACPTCRKGHGSIEGHVEKIAIFLRLAFTLAKDREVSRGVSKNPTPERDFSGEVFGLFG